MTEPTDRSNSPAYHEQGHRRSDDPKLGGHLQIRGYAAQRQESRVARHHGEKDPHDHDSGHRRQLQAG